MESGDARCLRLGHEILFGDEAARCDACGAAVDQDDDATPPGEGIYLRARGDEVRIERVPLCQRCAVGIGIAAQGLDDIEEDEG
jgi:hypothetical protein